MSEENRLSELEILEGREKMIRDGLKFEFYDEKPCPNCTRHRVGIRKNGKRICEKCCWDFDAGQYDADALNYT